MHAIEAREVALSMIRCYGTRAQAIASERLRQSRGEGDAAAVDAWEQVRAMIWELRRTERLVPRVTH